MILVTIAGKTFEIELTGFPLGEADFDIRVDDQILPVNLPGLNYGNVETDPTGYNLYLIIDGRPYEVILDRDFRWIQSEAGVFLLDLREKGSSRPRPRSGDGRLMAPIPGLITKVMIAEGDQVESGQPLLVLEAMKMENEIRAPHAGRIKSLLAFPGQSVSHNELLAEIVE